MPELSLTDFTTAGVTTAVGLLGTDSATRSPKALLAKTKALNEEGLTAYCLTGAYDVPSPTVTGSLKDDVTYLSEVLGVKVALSDHRGGHPTLEQFIHMACQVRLGALTAGKPVWYTSIWAAENGDSAWSMTCWRPRICPSGTSVPPT